MTIALVLGGSTSLWTDVEAAMDLGEYDGVVACNDAAAWWPGPVDAAVSYHAEKWPYWMSIRDHRKLERPKRIIGHVGSTAEVDKRYGYEFIPHLLPGQRETGSSGLFAAKVALVDLSFDRVVLCGIPMNPQGHFFDASSWSGWSAHRQGWIEAYPQLKRRVRSMSGWTAELLGKPTETWVMGERRSADAGTFVEGPDGPQPGQMP